MNTENVIEFIRRGAGLRLTKTTMWLSAIFFLLILCGCVPLAIFFDGVLRFWGIVTTVWAFVNLVCTAIFLRKNSPLKNKLIVGFTTGVFVECFLAIIFLIIYIGFYSSTYVVYIFSAVMIFMPILYAICCDVWFNKSKHMYSKKTKIKIIPFGGNRRGVATLRLLVGILIVCSGDFIPEKVFNVAFVCVIGILPFLCCGSITELQRFYYYNKLEKMGLVTEDILKPDKP